MRPYSWSLQQLLAFAASRLASLAVLLWRRATEYRRLAAFCLAWMVIAFLPYCFLTYMLRVPSRHTYLPSLGLAWLAAAGYDVLPRAVVVCCVIAVFALNLGTLWVKKRRQFQEHAGPAARSACSASPTPG